MTSDELDRVWSRSVAELAVFRLRDAKIVAQADTERAMEITADEILMRLALGDRPNPN
jgi:hypothetical protein